MGDADGCAVAVILVVDAIDLEIVGGGCGSAE